MLWRGRGIGTGRLDKERSRRPHKGCEISPQGKSGVFKQTVEVANKYGKPVAIGIGQPWEEEEARKYIDLGCRIIEISNDVGVLRSVWKSLSSTMKNV